MEVELLGTLALIDGRYVLLTPKNKVPGVNETYAVAPGCDFTINWGHEYVTFTSATVVDLQEFRPVESTAVPAFGSVEEADQWLTSLIP